MTLGWPDWKLIRVLGVRRLVFLNLFSLPLGLITITCLTLEVQKKILLSINNPVQAIFLFCNLTSRTSFFFLPGLHVPIIGFLSTYRPAKTLLPLPSYNFSGL